MPLGGYYIYRRRRRRKGAAKVGKLTVRATIMAQHKVTRKSNRGCVGRTGNGERLISHLT